MISLVLPDRTRWASWLAAMDEFGDKELHGFSIFGFTLTELREASAFDRWLTREIAQRTVAPHGFVPATGYRLPATGYRLVDRRRLRT